MRKYSCALIWALVFYYGFSTAFAQTTAVSTTKADLSKEAFIVEQESYVVSFENDGTGTRKENVRIRIQSDAGLQQYGVLTFPYQNLIESIAIDYVRVTKADGTVIETPADNVQDMVADITRAAPFYSDLREKHIAVKGLSIGDILEFQISWQITKPLAPGQFWYSFDFSHDYVSLQQQLQVSVPKTRSVKWDSRDIQPIITESGELRIFTWKRSQPEPQKSNKTKDDDTKLYQSERGKFPAAEIQISSFQTWDEVGRWYGSLQQDRVKPTAEIQAKAAELTKSANTQEAKIRAIYDYVSTQFRYIGVGFGIGRYQPHFATEVLNNGYGDCKDKQTLFSALLNAAGIKAYPALINSSHEMDLNVPAPSQFDHVIGVVPQEKNNLWLDTTPELSPFPYLLTILRDKPALIVRTDGISEIATTLKDPTSTGSEVFKMKAKLDDSGTLEGRVERTSRGDDMDVLIRDAFRQTPFTQWQDLIQRISYNSGFAGDVSDTNAGHPEQIEDPFNYSYTYKRKDFPDWSNRRVDAPLPPILMPSIPDDNTVPTHPIWLGTPTETQLTSAVEFPKGYTPIAPKNVDIVEDFAEYHAVYSVKDGVLATNRRFIVKSPEVPINKYDAYKKFSKIVTDDHSSQFALSSGNTSVMNYQDEIWALPSSDNAAASQAYQEAAADYQRGDQQAQINAVRHAVELDPKFIRAWLWLGEIYKYIGQPDLAIEAYRKAIEIDPNVIVSYKALGFTMLRYLKLEDALPVWRDLIKIAPDNPAGPTGLGFTLFQMNRYQDAIPALESALKLSPNELGVELDLAQAYLRTNQPEKAEAAYKHAIHPDSGAGVLAHTADEMASAKLDLDLAFQYAQQAVNDTEKKSADLKLDKVQMEDLMTVSTLADSWAAFGWVQFQKGNPEQAKKYLLASYHLIQRGETAYHLGLLYESEKSKAYAFEAYTQALAFGFMPSDPTRVLVQKRVDQLKSEPNAHLSPPDKDELFATRRIKLPRLLSGTESAEVYILLGPGDKVLDSSFISGSDKFKPFLKNLISVEAQFRQPFPDEVPSRIIRRAIMGCYEVTGCSLDLLPAYELIIDTSK